MDFLSNGFQVIFGNCYSSHFTRYERRTSKKGVIGAEVSVWAGTNEEDMGRLGKLYDMMYSTNLAWSTYCQDELRWTFDRRIAQLLPGIRSRLRGLRGHSLQAVQFDPLDLRAHLTAPRRDLTGARGRYDLSALPTGETTLCGIPFCLEDGVILVESQHVRAHACPDRVTVRIGAMAASILFAHACTTMGPIVQSIGVRQPIAQYQIHYADGNTESINVAYGHQVAEWNRRHGAPLGHQFHRHASYVATYPVDPLWQGKTPLGEDVTLYGMEWSNPHPEKEVQWVSIAAVDSGTNASLLVAAITVVRPMD